MIPTGQVSVTQHSQTAAEVSGSWIRRSPLDPRGTVLMSSASSSSQVTQVAPWSASRGAHRS
jgi:hypothetical protein